MIEFDSLTADEKKKVNMFMEITETTDISPAYYLLKNNNWDVEQAIGKYFVEGIDNIPTGDASQLEEAQTGNNRNNEVPIGDDFGNDGIQDIPDDSFGESSADFQKVESLMTIESQPVPRKLRQFVDNFEARYAPHHPDLVMPTFYTDTLKNAINIAFNHENENFRRPLVFFVNNEYSNLTGSFVRNLLCNQFVADLLREKFILFPWDITEDFNMIHLLQLMTDSNMKRIHEDFQNYVFSERAHFPLLMIINRKRYSFETIAKFDGRSDLNEVVNGLHDAYEQFRNDQLVEISRDLQQKKDREIFDEQNSAYKESLMADMVRINSERNMKELEAEEKRKEEIERKKAEVEENRRVKEYVSKLTEEPEESNPNCIIIRFRLPGGLVDTRRFLSSDKLQSLIDYLGSERFFPESCNYFNSEYPRKDIQKSFDLEARFADVKWPKKETVLVERTD